MRTKPNKWALPNLHPGSPLKQLEQVSSLLKQSRNSWHNGTGLDLKVNHLHPCVDLQSSWQLFMFETCTKSIWSPWHWPLVQLWTVIIWQSKAPPKHFGQALTMRFLQLLRSWHTRSSGENVNQPHLEMKRELSYCGYLLKIQSIKSVLFTFKY